MTLKTALAAAAAFILITGAAKAADLNAIIPQATVHEAVEQGPTKGDVWTGIYIDAGLGMTSNNIDASMAGTSITIGDTAWAGHIGIGADWMFTKHFVAGVFARAHMDDVAFKALSTKLADTDITYSIGARLGFVPRNDWMVYVLGGYRFASLDTVGAPDIDANAWLVGGGIEAMLTDNWFIGVEGIAALGETDNNAAGVTGLSVEATDYSGTVRVGYRF